MSDPMETNGQAKLSRQQRERKKRKERKKKRLQVQSEYAALVEAQKKSQEATGTDDDVEIEYVEADPLASVGVHEAEEGHLDEFKAVFHKFQQSAASALAGPGLSEASSVAQAANAADEDAPQKPEKLSNKRKKQQKRMNIAVLKQLVARPDLVELHDTCAANPVRRSDTLPCEWKRLYFMCRCLYHCRS